MTFIRLTRNWRMSWRKKRLSTRRFLIPLMIKTRNKCDPLSDCKQKKKRWKKCKNYIGRSLMKNQNLIERSSVFLKNSKRKKKNMPMTSLSYKRRPNRTWSYVMKMIGSANWSSRSPVSLIVKISPLNQNWMNWINNSPTFNNQAELKLKMLTITPWINRA